MPGYGSYEESRLSKGNVFKEFLKHVFVSEHYEDVETGSVAGWR